MVRRIAVAALESGLGATTQALQLYGYADYCGHDAALRMEQEQFENYRKDRAYQKINLVTAEKAIKDCDYLIIDYGAITDAGFRRDEYLAEPVRILVTESDPLSEDALIQKAGENAIQIISFGADIFARDRIYVSDIIHDPVSPSGSPVYRQIFEEVDQVYDAMDTKKNLLGSLRQKGAEAKERLKASKDRKKAEPVKKPKPVPAYRPGGGAAGYAAGILVVVAVFAALRLSFMKYDMMQFIKILLHYLLITV